MTLIASNLAAEEPNQSLAGDEVTAYEKKSVLILVGFKYTKVITKLWIPNDLNFPHIKTF